MRAPVAFAVLRHRLTHPDEQAALVAKHCRLHDSSVRTALRRVQAEGLWRDEDLLLKLRTTAERPRHKRLHFSVPNPDQFLNALSVLHWISGEYAAAAEGYDLVPERLLVYVRESDAEAATRTALREFAKVAPPSKANLTIALCDPWLYLDTSSDLVERGQRLLDYADSRHIQILRGLQRG